MGLKGIETREPVARIAKPRIKKAEETIKALETIKEAREISERAALTSASGTFWVALGATGGVGVVGVSVGRIVGKTVEAEPAVVAVIVVVVAGLALLALGKALSALEDHVLSRDNELSPEKAEEKLLELEDRVLSRDNELSPEKAEEKLLETDNILILVGKVVLLVVGGVGVGVGKVNVLTGGVVAVGVIVGGEFLRLGGLMQSEVGQEKENRVIK